MTKQEQDAFWQAADSAAKDMLTWPKWKREAANRQSQIPSEPGLNRSIPKERITKRQVTDYEVAAEEGYLASLLLKISDILSSGDLSEALEFLGGQKTNVDKILQVFKTHTDSKPSVQEGLIYGVLKLQENLTNQCLEIIKSIEVRDGSTIDQIKKDAITVLENK